jgi:hypothetical protein
LIDIKKYLGDEVYLLCALSTTLSALGYSKLGNFVADISEWWSRVEHPRGLALLVRK